jgi:hypothetical protein
MSHSIRRTTTGIPLHDIHTPTDRQGDACIDPKTADQSESVPQNIAIGRILADLDRIDATTLKGVALQLNSLRAETSGRTTIIGSQNTIASIAPPKNGLAMSGFEIGPRSSFPGLAPPSSAWRARIQATKRAR